MSYAEWMEEREQRKRGAFAVTPPPAPTPSPKKKKRPCEIVITMRQDKQHLNVRCRCEAPTARRGISRVWPVLAVTATIHEATLLWQMHVEEPEEGTVGDDQQECGVRAEGRAGPARPELRVVGPAADDAGEVERDDGPTGAVAQAR